MDRCTAIASSVRTSIDSASDSDRPDILLGFPSGRRNAACYFVSERLRECGEPNSLICYGSKPTNTDDFFTHAWLQFGSTVLDIAADQFGEGYGAIVVTNTGDL